MATKSKTSTSATDPDVRGARPKAKRTKPPATKKDRLQTLLRRKGGASLDMLQKEFDWKPHTVRAAISGLRKAGDRVVFEAGKSGPVYRIVTISAAQ